MGCGCLGPLNVLPFGFWQVRGPPQLSLPVCHPPFTSLICSSNHYFLAKSVNFNVFVGILDAGMICFVNFFFTKLWKMRIWVGFVYRFLWMHSSDHWDLGSVPVKFLDFLLSFVGV